MGGRQENTHSNSHKTQVSKCFHKFTVGVNNLVNRACQHAVSR
jgi:hypothetical protein